MRGLLLFVVPAVAACAATARTCPSQSKLATEDRPTGRVEWCAHAAGGPMELPGGRSYQGGLGAAQPATLSGNFDGPFTHWYPDGALESHGSYVPLPDGGSVPDGVWGFWYADGKRRAVGRFSRGTPVGCFALWDERGNEVDGMVEGDKLLDAACTPPGGADLEAAEQRSHPLASRGVWGDISVDTLAQAGRFGARNETQADPDPSVSATIAGTVRKAIGPLRIGGALALRLADSRDTRAYAVSAVAAYQRALPVERLAAEVEARAGVQYFDITLHRPVGPGAGPLGLWSPLFGARVALAYAVVPAFSIILGASVEGSFAYDSARSEQYCAPLCSSPVTETWKMGGAAYGVDLGLRLTLR